MPQKIAIVDYSTGNIHSVAKRLKQLGADVVVCRHADELAGCDKVVLPGVGHFGQAMRELHRGDLLQALHEVAFGRQMPVLGICLGLQLMARGSEEEIGSAGLGWFPADVVRFRQADAQAYRTPHTGWNTLEILHPMGLLRNLSANNEFSSTQGLHFFGKSNRALR